jgi:hypothetical protein
MMYKHKKGLRVDGASEHHKTPEYNPRRRKKALKYEEPKEVLRFGAAVIIALY